MMKKKWILAFTVVAVLCNSLWGCEKTADMPESAATNVEIPMRYEKEAENISFQTDVAVSEEVRENGMRKLSASVQKPDPAKALECLMGDAEIKEKNEEENNYWYVGADGESLTVNGTSVGFSTRFFTYVNNAFRLQQEYSGYNADKYDLDKDLGFATRQEAFETIRRERRALPLRCTSPLWRDLQGIPA